MPTEAIRADQRPHKKVTSRLGSKAKERLSPPFARWRLFPIAHIVVVLGRVCGPELYAARLLVRNDRLEENDLDANRLAPLGDETGWGDEVPRVKVDDVLPGYVWGKVLEVGRHRRQKAWHGESVAARTLPAPLQLAVDDFEKRRGASARQVNGVAAQSEPIYLEESVQRLDSEDSIAIPRTFDLLHTPATNLAEFGVTVRAALQTGPGSAIRAPNVGKGPRAAATIRHILAIVGARAVREGASHVFSQGVRVSPQRASKGCFTSSFFLLFSC